MDRWLSWLRCPFCGGSLKCSEPAALASSGEPYGTLTCYCGRYPIVDGIPVLKKGPAVDEAVALIEHNAPEQALLSLLLPPAPDHHDSGRLRRLITAVKGLRGFARANAKSVERSSPRVILAELLGHPDKATLRGLLGAYFHDKPDNYDYFVYRFSQPRYLVALSFANIISHPTGPILDLACGCGHITHHLWQRARNQPVVGVDRFLFGLYIAKHLTAPQATYVCCEFDAAWPFADGTFEAAVCSDAFHYFLNKKACVRELRRLLRDDGFFILVWVHSSNVRMAHDGSPLPPEGYLELVADMPHCLLADSQVLARYLQRQGPPLSRSVDLDALRHEPLLSLVASRRMEIFKNYGEFEDWPHARGNLRLNPLYAVGSVSEQVSLRRIFPSAFYEKEHAQCKDYLPENVNVTVEVLNDLAQGKRRPEIDDLVARLVVVGVPEHCVHDFEVPLATCSPF